MNKQIQPDKNGKDRPPGLQAHIEASQHETSTRKTPIMRVRAAKLRRMDAGG